MPKILVAGDTHTSHQHVLRLIESARKEGASAIVQVGDWGFTWPRDMPGCWTDFQKIIDDNEFPFFFLEGNHDNYDWLREVGAFESDVPFELTENITYLPRGAMWEWGDLKFMSCGGGVSIDKDDRIPGYSWWEDELVTDEDLRKVFAAGPVDVLLTHDAPNNPTLTKLLIEKSLKVQAQGYANYKMDALSEANRAQLDLVFQSAQPKVVIHGHYHHFYVNENYDTGQRIVGLGRDGQGRESWLILDTETLR